MILKKPIFVFVFITFIYTKISAQPIPNAKYDIGFVLRGYDSTQMFRDTASFGPIAKQIMKYINELSFGKIGTYKTYMNGIDWRSSKVITSQVEVMTLQASLDGWTAPRWSWLSGRTDYWAVVPTFYRPIITNAINWLSNGNRTFSEWKTQTNEGQLHGDSVETNVIRMGPSAGDEYLQGLNLPLGYNYLNHGITIIILNTFSSYPTNGGVATTLNYLGIRQPNGEVIPSFATIDNQFIFIRGGWWPTDSMKFTSVGTSYFYTAVHELVHAFGVLTHDRDPNNLNSAYGVLNSFGAVECVNTLPAWDRYFFAKWLPKSTITTNINEVADLKGKILQSDTTRKFIFQVVAGDSNGCGGTYKELYDGKWYTYTVDNYGTLTYTVGIDNTNYGVPIVEVHPFDQNVKIGEKSFFTAIASGLPNILWKKNGVIIPGATNPYLSIQSASVRDIGSYQMVASNNLGTVTTNFGKLVLSSLLQQIFLNISKLDFGLVKQSAIKDTVFVIKNIGNDTLRITKISSSSDLFVPANRNGFNIAPGVEASSNIKFSPSSLGSLSAKLYIESNSQNTLTTDSIDLVANVVTKVTLGNTLPTMYSINQNYPNPFNPSTTIRFAIPKDAFVKLEIYNSLGQMVETIIDKNLPAHFYEVKWEAGRIPSGLYFYKLIAIDKNNSKNNFVKTMKMMLMK